MAVIDGDNYAFEIQLRSLNLTIVLKKCTGAFGNEGKKETIRCTYSLKKELGHYTAHPHCSKY